MTEKLRKGFLKVSDKAFRRRTHEMAERWKREEEQRRRLILAGYPSAEDLPLGEFLRLGKKATK